MLLDLREFTEHRESYCKQETKIFAAQIDPWKDTDTKKIDSNSLRDRKLPIQDSNTRHSPVSYNDV